MNIELAYLAGIFDGEGWIQIQKGHATPGVRSGVSMCCEEIIRMLHGRWGGKVYNYPKRLKSGRTDFWEWHANGEVTYRALTDMRPLLIVKRPIVDWAIELTGLMVGSRRWAGGKHGHRLPEPERARRFELAALIQDAQSKRNGRTPALYREYLPPAGMSEACQQGRRSWMQANRSRIHTEPAPSLG